MSFESFDWVKARSECSIAQVWEALKMEIENDVNKRNALSANAIYRFKYIACNGAVAVTIEGPGVQPRNVRFTRGENAIQVDKDNEEVFRAVLTLNNEGKCRMKIANGEYHLWQVRKMALEELFFQIARL